MSGRRCLVICWLEAKSVDNEGAAFLSNEIEEMIRIHYAPQEQAIVRARLLSFAARWPNGADRVLFDLLYLGAGDADRLVGLADVAERDPRDVMGGEYLWAGGRSYPHEWARRHAVNRDSPEPPRLSTTVLATAELILRAQPRDRASTLEQQISRGKPQKVPSLILSFSDIVQLLAFGDQLLALAVPGGVLDLSEVLRYLGRNSPERTILHCLRGGEPETLTHDGEELAWNADADHWNECHLKCIQLAESDIGFRDMMTPSTVDRQVRVKLDTLVSRWT
jgi:hypothetical protein